MHKHVIFGHLIDTMVYVAQKGAFKNQNSPHRAALTGFPAAPFNYVCMNDLKNDGVITDLIHKKIPFICFPEEAAIPHFETFCTHHRLIKTNDIVAHDFPHLASWHFTPNPQIRIEHVKKQQDLEHFDAISRVVFNHASHLVVDFFGPSYTQDDIALYLAFYEGSPVGCGILSFVDNKAGLYWGGVLPQYRNKGIGSELTKYRMHIAQQRHFENIVAQNLPASIGYYQKIGFTPKGATPLCFYLGDGAQQE